MQYNGSLEQKIALIDALNELQTKGISSAKLMHKINDARKKGMILGFTKDSGVEISRATIERYRDDYDPKTARMRYDSAGLMYNFLLQSKDFNTALLVDSALTDTAHELSPLINQFMQHFGTKNEPFDKDVLKSLEGTFHAYRKAWSSIKKKTFIRSVVKFERHGSSLIYTDTQDYYDPISDTLVHQSDTGFVVPFNVNVIMIGKGAGRELLKFCALHDFTPYPNGIDPIDAFEGSFTVVYNKRQHLGFQVLARRVKPERAQSKFYNEGEVDKEIERILLASLKKQAEVLLTA
ncbi:MAG: hypothetical protein COA69_04075 [Robiginitomaculum sp.]|nr:MAG: hypothetical protein COA69_04075 [Robiginitomaculum sp.]